MSDDPESTDAPTDAGTDAQLNPCTLCSCADFVQGAGTGLICLRSTCKHALDAHGVKVP